MIQNILLRTAGFALVWWVLAEGRNDGWALGGVAILAATWASLVLLPPTAQRIHVAALARFLAFFISNSVRGGAQVALLALRGSTALQPDIVTLPMQLPPGGPRVLLAYTLGLMPGTLSVDLAGDILYMHVLDARLPVAAEVQALEDVIARMWGEVT